MKQKKTKTMMAICYAALAYFITHFIIGLML